VIKVNFHRGKTISIVVKVSTMVKICLKRITLFYRQPATH